MELGKGAEFLVETFAGNMGIEPGQNFNENQDNVWNLSCYTCV